MNASQLRERVQLQAPRDTPDGAGGFTRQWVGLGEVWARVLPVGGREQLLNEALRDITGYRVTIRWRADITVQCRLVWRGQILAIRNTLNPDERRAFLELVCDTGIGA